MKLGTLREDPCGIIFRLGPNSETPPGGRHLEFQYAAILHVLLPITLKLRQVEM